MKHFDYNYTETSRPQRIGSRQILNEGKPLKLSASQALLLVKLLPLLVGDVIPKDDEHWKCFLILCGIVDIIICPWSSIDLTAILKNQIRNHHQAFISLYTVSAILFLSSILFYTILMKF